MKKLFRSKIFWSVIILVLLVRLIAPPLILNQLNAFLKDFSPIYEVHIGSLGLGLFRGSYQIRDLSVKLKEHPEEVFLQTKIVDVSLAWRDLFKGQLTTDVLIDGAHILLTKNVLESTKKAKEQAQEDTNEAKEKIFPFRIERVDVRNSDFEFADLVSMPKESRWRLSNIEGRLSNVTSSQEAPLSFLSAEADLFDTAPVKLVSQMNLVDKPVALDFDLEVRDFNLPDANGWLKKTVPFTFTSGKFDLYAEAKYENDRLEGYAKPFMHRADIVANEENFAGLKHFGIEVGTAAANLFLRNSKEKTVATKILFSYEDGNFNINSAKALTEAFKNGFTEELNPGLEDQISLSASSRKPETQGEKP